VPSDRSAGQPDDQLAEELAERKRATDLLRDSEERLRLAITAANQGLYDLNVQTGEALVSAEYAAMLGYDPAEFHETNAAWIARLHPDDREGVASVYRDYVAGRLPEYRVEFRQRTRSGDWKWILSLGKVVERDGAGRPLRMLGTHTDITERRRAEERLQALSARRQALLDAIPDIVMEVDTRKVYTWANQPGIEFFGHDVIGREAGDYFEGEQRTYDLVNPLFGGSQEAVYLESWQRRRDGQKRLLAWWCRTLRDEHGSVTGAISSARDITEAMRVEQALKQSEERFASFMRHLPGFAFVKDHDRRVLFVNERFESAFGLALPDWQGKTNDEIWPGEVGEKIRRDDEAVLAAGEPCAIVEVVPTHGELRTYRTIKFPIPRPDGRPWLGGMSVDITELKQAEEALRTSLAEKVVLLKEVHHRVKNNLQIISSLLNLQAAKVQNPEVQSLLRDTQGRVRAMAVLHETLYGSDILSRVNFRDYVQTIGSQVVRSFVTDGQDIRLVQDVADVMLPLDQAIPAGLILNELLSNALKHAFADRACGEITVQLRFADDGHYMLRVADDGVGLSGRAGFAATESIGLLLVEGLVRQLDGELTVSQEPGTTFQIVFPIQPA
jgi:PAS domain S-box-containing protein